MIKTRFRRIVTLLFPITVLALGLHSGVVFAKSKHTAAKVNNPNQLAGSQGLNNIYIAVRHGESVPSAEHRVCGTMEAGTDPANGLTAKGREEVKQSTLNWIKENKKVLIPYLEKNNLVIITSPFSRTRETADIVADTIQGKLKKYFPKSMQQPGALKANIIVENNLRERFFGKFEGQGNSDDVYKQVWAEDAKNPNNTKEQVESPNAVQSRTTGVVANLEKTSSATSGGKVYLLVSHGDSLKILQTGFQKQSASAHCNPNFVPKFKTAEFRQFTLGGTSTSTATR